MKKIILTCDECGEAPLGTYYEGRLHDISFPTTKHGGIKYNYLQDRCWTCYTKICNDLDKIYKKHKNSENELQAEMDELTK